MAEDGIVGSYNGNSAREVLMTLADWEATKAAAGDEPAPKKQQALAFVTEPEEDEGDELPWDDEVEVDSLEGGAVEADAEDEDEHDAEEDEYEEEWEEDEVEGADAEGDEELEDDEEYEDEEAEVDSVAEYDGEYEEEDDEEQLDDELEDELGDEEEFDEEESAAAYDDEEEWEDVEDEYEGEDFEQENFDDKEFQDAVAAEKDLVAGSKKEVVDEFAGEDVVSDIKEMKKAAVPKAKRKSAKLRRGESDEVVAKLNPMKQGGKKVTVHRSHSKK